MNRTDIQILSILSILSIEADFEFSLSHFLLKIPSFFLSSVEKRMPGAQAREGAIFFSGEGEKGGLA